MHLCCFMGQASNCYLNNEAKQRWMQQSELCDNPIQGMMGLRTRSYTIISARPGSFFLLSAWVLFILLFLLFKCFCWLLDKVYKRDLLIYMTNLIKSV
jgi:hypothetical protein